MHWRHFLFRSAGAGIHGNFGHEYGAMIPGALATLTLDWLSGRGNITTEVRVVGVARLARQSTPDSCYDRDSNVFRPIFRRNFCDK